MLIFLIFLSILFAVLVECKLTASENKSLIVKTLLRIAMGFFIFYGISNLDLKAPDIKELDFINVWE